MVVHDKSRKPAVSSICPQRNCSKFQHGHTFQIKLWARILFIQPRRHGSNPVVAVCWTLWTKSLPPRCFGKKLQTQPVKMLVLPARLFFALSTRGNRGIFYLGLGNRLSTSSLKFWIGAKRFRKWTAPRQEPRLRRNSGGRNRIRTCEGKASRFTVCPRWPLGYPTFLNGADVSFWNAWRQTELAQNHN